MPALMEKLFELVRKNPPLYDASDSRHKDAVLIANIWDKIADSMGVDGTDGQAWRKKWRNQRDQFVRGKREMKTKSGQAAKTAVKWKYMDVLSFLVPYVMEAPTESNYTYDSDHEKSASVMGDQACQQSDVETNVSMSAAWYTCWPRPVAVASPVTVADRSRFCLTVVNPYRAGAHSVRIG
ncbi:transcription factor Adf-1-like [Patiria miniata]|uniref:MADF domain-containing protein n=1 Tax=Patiria miniata TaxID=46514 RepID=A0A914A5L4_PATMI|nr:transcription factor Adf-1-like [Patiria miniata]